MLINDFVHIVLGRQDYEKDKVCDVEEHDENIPNKREVVLSTSNDVILN